MYSQAVRFSLGIMLLCCTLASKSAKAVNLESFDPIVIQVKRQEHFERKINPVVKNEFANHTINIDGDNFMLDGQSLHIVSGSLHYFRVPAAYWRDRLRKLKAAGLNSVATYVEWSFHEPEERQYKFEGDRDVARFIRIAAEEGLHVLLRPGPYICAERDLGGLPYWLLGKYPNIKLRTTDSDFILETKTWMMKLFEQLTPLLFGNGGPIILVQVENEYGSYGKNMAYKVQLRDILFQHVGTNALLYTTDGSSNYYFSGGAIPGTLTTIDFGPTADSMQKVFRPLRSFMPHGPLMNSEYYTGWLTHWRERFARTSTDDVVRTLNNMLDNKINVNFYMFYGGTNFEFSAGANYDGTYQPDITSYDYDAPLTEAGDPTPKYYAIRETLKRHNFEDEKNDPPTPASKGAYGVVTVSPKVSLLSTQGRAALGKKYDDVTGSTLPTFEHLRQRSGLVLYETTLGETSGLLEILKPRDLVLVFVDGIPQGIISRMRKIYSVPLSAKNGSILSLFVENQGRINFGSHIHDFKGILGDIKFNNKILNGKWTVTGYPLEVVDSAVAGDLSGVSQGPTFYDGEFTLPERQAPLDTFLDPTGWGKGYIWVNGNNLGRYWPRIGPQVTLYVPGVWLKAAPEENHIQILEFDKPPANHSIQFLDYPILNRTTIIALW